MATKLGEDTQVQLDLKTIGMIVGGAIALASMWFTLQGEIKDLQNQVAPEEFVKQMEFKLKDELIRSTIIQIEASTNLLKEDIMHINAKWNQSNNFDLRGIKEAKVQYALLEDQAPSLRAQIKSVPLIILLDKAGKPRGQWTADLTFKITATKDEIQDRIYFLLSKD